VTLATGFLALVALPAAFALPAGVLDFRPVVVLVRAVAGPARRWADGVTPGQYPLEGPLTLLGHPSPGRRSCRSAVVTRHALFAKKLTRACANATFDTAAR
jgi:hypothetical protein